MEVVEVNCGGGESRRTLKRQALIDAKWDAANESYVLPGGQVFSVRGMPTRLKDQIERVRISSMIDEKAAQLEEALGRERSSDRVLSVYDLLVLAAVMATFLWILNLQQPLGYLLLAPLLVALSFARRQFARRFAPWSGFLFFEDVLFIRIRRAAKELDRFLVDGKTVFLDEAVKSLLSVSSLTNDWTMRTTSRLAWQVGKEAKDVAENIATRIAPHARRSREPKTFSRLVLGRLKGLLPILAKPDIATIASWNEAVRNEFPTAEGRPTLTAFGRAFLSKPRVMKVFTLIGILLSGYFMAVLILFAFHSLLTGHLLQASDFFTLLKESSSTYLILSNGLAAVVAVVWLRTK
jgi:hypothetical protein